MQFKPKFTNRNAVFSIMAFRQGVLLVSEIVNYNQYIFEKSDSNKSLNIVL